MSNTKKPTAAGMQTALTLILEKVKALDTAFVSGDEALDTLIEIQDIADAALSPKAGPSAMELKTKEVANFILADFRLVFASNDEIGDKLNAAEILSPAGKPWSRSNVSKIMSGVKELIVDKMSPEAVVSGAEEAAGQLVEAPVADLASEVTKEPEVAAACSNNQEEFVVVAPEPIVVEAEPEVSPEDELLEELDGLEELEGLNNLAA
jgi:hypothetical protein